MTSPTEHMLEALSLAKKGLLTTRPNPMVGCIITLDNKIIGRGWHKKAGDGHAEVNAIQDVFDNLGPQAQSSLERSEMYVTLEPCSTTGQTPPCSEAIKKHGIKKVYIASRDSSQNGFAKKEKDIEIVEGLLEVEARELNRGFFSRIEKNRPFVTAKMATGLDGGIALWSGESKWITSEASRDDVQLLRSHNQAIITGSGTILNDNPMLTVRNKKLRSKPLRVVIDSNNSITDKSLNIFSSDSETLILNKDNSKILENGKIDLELALKKIGDLGINNVLLESGSGLNSAMMKSKLIDEFIIYTAPVILGSDAQAMMELPFKKMSEKISLSIIEITQVATDLKIRAKPL